MIDREKFYASIRSPLFDGELSQRQVDGITAIFDCWDKSAQTDLRWLAEDLAEVYHETERAMYPVREVGEGRGHAYGVPTGPWHQVYYGRGDEQETWLRNYELADRRLHELGILKPDENLVKTPDLALRLDVSAAIVIYGNAEGWFTGKKLSDYFSATKDDPVNARRIVNGIDKAQTIAGYYGHFLAALHIAAPTVAALNNAKIAVASKTSAQVHQNGAIAIAGGVPVAAAVIHSHHWLNVPIWIWPLAIVAALIVALYLYNKSLGLAQQSAKAFITAGAAQTLAAQPSTPSSAAAPLVAPSK